MGCPCKKKFNKIIEYDKKLASIEGRDLSSAQTVDVTEEESFSMYDFILKIFNPIIGLFKGLIKVIVVMLVVLTVMVVMIPYLFYMIVMKMIFNKDVGGVHNPFYGISKFISRKTAEHQDSIKQFKEWQKNADKIKAA